MFGLFHLRLVELRHFCGSSRRSSPGGLAFLWVAAGRPADAPTIWRRERPLRQVRDNYSVHGSELVPAEARPLAAAGIHPFYLPAQSPELPRTEPIWQDVKYRWPPVRSYADLGELKRAVDRAQALKSVDLRRARRGTLSD